MSIPFWVLGIAFLLLVGVKWLWAIDLLLAEARRRQGWRSLPRSGPFWLAVFNVASGILQGWFAVITLQTPHRQIDGLIALLVLVIAGSAGLAWFFLPRQSAQETPR